MPARWKMWFNLHLHAVIIELAMRREEINTLSVRNTLDTQYPAEKEKVDKIRASVLGDLLNEMLEELQEALVA